MVSGGIPVAGLKSGVKVQSGEKWYGVHMMKPLYAGPITLRASPQLPRKAGTKNRAVHILHPSNQERGSYFSVRYVLRRASPLEGNTIMRWSPGM